MTILHVVESMLPEKGGISQAIRTMINSLTEINVINEVVCLDQPIIDKPKDDNIKITALGSGVGPWKYKMELFRWMRQNFQRFDIVIVHGLWLYPGHAAIRALKVLKNGKDNSCPSLFIMPHGMLDPYFQNAPDRTLKAIRNLIFWKLIENKVVNKADGLLFTCEMEKQLSRTTFKNYKPKKESVIGLGIIEPPQYSISMSEAFQKTNTLRIGKPYWLYISRIHEKKGVDLLIQAYISLKQSGKTLPALVIAGPGLETVFGKKMLNLATACDSIYFTGMLTGNAKWGAFYGCEAFVLPSHQENFGIAVVEALACKKAVLISKQINIWSEIHQENGGIMGDPTQESVESMLSAWLDLTEDQKNQMGINAYRAFEKNFRITSATTKLVRILHGAL